MIDAEESSLKDRYITPSVKEERTLTDLSTNVEPTTSKFYDPENQNQANVTWNIMLMRCEEVWSEYVQSNRGNPSLPRTGTFGIGPDTEDRAPKDETKTKQGGRAKRCVSFAQQDLFPYEVQNDEGTNQKHQSLLGFLGSLGAISFILFLFYHAISEFAYNLPTVTRELEKREPSDTASLPKVAALWKKDSDDNNSTFDKRFFHWEISLRAIFNGNTDGKIVVEAIPKNCYAYEGSMAYEGCVDMDALTESLTKTKMDHESGKNPSDPDDIPSEPIIQGKYGEPTYWYLSVALFACDKAYADKEGLSCANETEWATLWNGESNVSVDFVYRDQVSREASINGSAYYYLNKDETQYNEILFDHVVSQETLRVFPAVSSEDPLNYLHFHTTETRTSARRTTDDPLAIFYVRLSDQKVAELYQYPNAFDCLNDIGGAVSFVMVFFGIFFVNANRYLVMTSLREFRQKAFHCVCRC